MKRFRNVPRHNGFRAWRVMTTPINGDKAEVQRVLLKSVTNPVAATSVEGLEKALKEWEISKRLFTEADGKLPEPETMRLVFVAMLPHEVYSYPSAAVGGDNRRGYGLRANKCVDLGKRGR